MSTDSPLRLRRSTLVVTVAGVVLVGGALTALVAETDTDADHPAAVADLHGEMTLPSRRMADWRTFSDAALVIDVTNEWFGEKTGDNPAEGYAPRTVTGWVESVIWERPESRVSQRAINLDTVGNIIGGGGSFPATIDGCPRLVVGRRYLVVVARFENDRFGPFVPCAVIALAGDGTLEKNGLVDPPEEFSQVWGSRPEALGEMLRNTQPLVPDADLRGLTAQERLDAVNRG